jgi:hypothetical protein
MKRKILGSILVGLVFLVTMQVWCWQANSPLWVGNTQFGQTVYTWVESLRNSGAKDQGWQNPDPSGAMWRFRQRQQWNINVSVWDQIHPGNYSQNPYRLTGPPP